LAARTVSAVASERRSARAIVESGYDAVASNEWLAELLAPLREGSSVLEVGCGNGIPATQAIAERHSVTGIDVSAEQVERARCNVPSARLLQADLTDVTFDQPFDAIAAFYVVDHLPRELHAAMFQRSAALLRRVATCSSRSSQKTSPGWCATGLALPCSSANTTLLALWRWFAARASRSSTTSRVTTRGAAGSRLPLGAGSEDRD
jgi:SAM-dependent methyltransferase